MSLQEDAKKILPFVQAIAEGKTVEQRLSSGGWFVKQRAGSWSSDSEYRIKPEKKWRPYTREEWEGITRVRSKAHGAAYLVLAVHGDYIEANNNSYTFDMAMRVFTNLDGSPLGVEVEE